MSSTSKRDVDGADVAVDPLDGTSRSGSGTAAARCCSRPGGRRFGSQRQSGRVCREGLAPDVELDDRGGVDDTRKGGIELEAALEVAHRDADGVDASGRDGCVHGLWYQRAAVVVKEAPHRFG